MKLTSGIILSLLFAVGALTSFAQNGAIKGKVLDVRNDESKPIFGAQVFIDGTSFGGFTNQTGEFEIKNVPAGEYTVTASYVLIGTEKVEKVKVVAGETTEVTVEMGKAVTQVQGIKLVLKKEEESEEAAISEVKNETKVVEVLSNQEMSKKGDNNASSAAKRISGVSVVEGKYVFVRGLSDRYAKTLLNASEIPGLDPNRNAVQLDLFPSSFISSMKVIKTFSPDLPGDFSGGLVDIRTRENFDSLTIKVSGGISYNPQVHLNSDFLSYEGGPTDFLGVDFSRDWDDAITNSIDNDNFRRVLPTLSTAEIERMEALYASFNNNIGQTTITSPLNHNIGLTLGNSIKKPNKKDTLAPDRELSFFGGLNYRRSYSYYSDGTREEWELIGTLPTGSMLPRFQRNVERSNDEVLLGLLWSTSLRFNPNNKLTLNLIHNNNGTKTAGLAEGSVGEGIKRVRIRELDYQERSINSAQLAGEHDIDSLLFNKKATVTWHGTYTNSRQSRPDYVIWEDSYDADENGNPVTDDEGNPIYRILASDGSRIPSRFQRAMNQHNIDVKGNISIPITLVKNDSVFREMKWKSGVSLVNKIRDFEERRVNYREINEDFVSYDGDPEALLVEENFGLIPNPNSSSTSEVPGVVMENQTSLGNSYDASMTVFALYTMAELPIGDKFDFIGGARFERTDMLTETRDPEEPEVGTLENNDVLPSANLVYKIIERKQKPDKFDTTKTMKQDMKLRFSYNRTLARPSFREKTPFLQISGVDPNSLGNPDLKRTLIDNFDVRLEFYPQTGEIMSISGFVKIFRDPIQQVQNASINQELGWANVPEGRLIGIEAEFRRSLRFISPKIENFRIALNGALIQSQVDLSETELNLIRNGGDPFHDDTRPFSGQSPYILNATLEYDNDSLGLAANLTYNLFGDRLAIATADGRPNIYEEARGELNFNVSKKIGDRLKLTFRARNLLNPFYSFAYKVVEDDPEKDEIRDGEYFFFRYKKGISLGLSASYTF